MSDLNQNLLGARGKKGNEKKQKRFQECQNKIKAVRSKNNELQKQWDNQIEGDIRATLKWQISFVDIKQMRKCLQKLSKDFIDPSSKQKIKQLGNLASKQMQRNKRIMRQFINRASVSPTLRSTSQQNLSAYRRSRTQFDKDIPQWRENALHPVEQKQDSSYMLSNDQISDLKIEQQMLAQRNQAIKQLQQQNNKINALINEMGSIIGGEQKDMIEKIGQNLQNANDNMEDVNENLMEAQKHQKKSKKKIILLAVLICVIVAILAGVVFFLTK